MSGMFNIDQLASAVAGTLGQVRIAYGAYMNLELPLTTLVGELRAEVGSTQTTRVGTVREVFERTGAVEKMRRIDEQLRAKGHPVNEGYTISIVDADGSTVLQSTDLPTALDHEVYDGYLISVLGKVSGR